jgi:hypothetical protein
MSDTQAAVGILGKGLTLLRCHGGSADMRSLFCVVRMRAAPTTPSTYVKRSEEETSQRRARALC